MHHVCHAVDIMSDKGGWIVCGTWVSRTNPIPSQRARASSVGKTQSFSFCQVDMYVRVTVGARV